MKLELRLKAVAATASVHDDVGRTAVVGAARQGSESAVAEIYDRHHGRIRRLARRLLGDDAAAEDLVQEVFADLPRALRRFRGEAGLDTFLASMVINGTRRHLRGAIRRRRALERLAVEPPPAAASLDDDLEARELAAALVRALDQLPLAQRVAFVLCEVQGLTSAEAAALAAAPEPTIRTRLFHARRRLRALLQPELTSW